MFHAFGDLRKLPMRTMAAFDLPVGEFMALQRIGAQDLPGERSVSDLHDKARFSMSAVSQSLASLERKGYVTRSMSAQDRRKITVSLTPEGEAFLRRIDERMDQTMQRVVERYGEADMWRLMEQVQRLLSVMEQVHHEMDLDEMDSEAQAAQESSVPKRNEKPDFKSEGENDT